MRPALHTPRLAVTGLTAEDLDLWVAGDAAGLQRVLRVRFPDPVLAPPLLEEDLHAIADVMRVMDTPPGWCVWLFSRLEDDVPVGAAGFSGRPDSSGVVQIGYSIYPAYERRGYCTEGVRAVLDWAWREPALQTIRATIPPWNLASLRVAEKLGLIRKGTDVDPDVGEVIVFEERR